MFGGVAAAPAVVKPTIPVAMPSAFPLTAALAATELGPDPDADRHSIFGSKFDKAKRLMKLRRLITGKETEREGYWSVSRRFSHFEETRLNNLKSVSASAKVLMLHRHLSKRAEIDRRISWIEEFARLREDD